MRHLEGVWRASIAVITALAASVASVDSAADDVAEAAVYSMAQAARGESLYRANCVNCHGARLEGNPGAALTGPGFRARWEDGSHTLDDFYYIVRTLMPNNAPGSLTRAEYADVVAYILKVNGYPAGDADLLPKGAHMKAFMLRPH